MTNAPSLHFEDLDNVEGGHLNIGAALGNLDGGVHIVRFDYRYAGEAIFARFA